MNEQRALFDAPGGRVRHHDPATSVAAARSVKPGALEQRIRTLIASCGPMTADELVERMPDVYPPTAKSAISRAGLRATGTTRPSKRGREQIVWGLRVETLRDIGHVA